MKKYVKYLVVVGLFAFFGVIFNTNNTYAKYINSANVNWVSTICNRYEGGRCVSWGDSYFTVSLKYGTDCGNNCVVEKAYFKCCGTVYQSEWSNSATSIQVTKGVESGGYEYYNVKLYNNRGNYQPVCGQIKKKKDLKKGRLVITGKNIYNDYNIISGGKNLGHQEIEAVGLVYAQYKNLWNNRTDKYKFIGWKLKGKNRPGIENIIEDMDSSHSPYVANPTSGYNNWTKRVYQRLYYNLGEGEAKDIYAYYAPACTITIDGGEGTTVSAYRDESVYSGIGSLPNGFDIYFGDKIGVTFGLKEGYRWTLRSINNNSVSVDNASYTVGHRTSSETGTCENVKIVARAERVDDDGDTESINTNVSIDIKKNDEGEFSKDTRYVSPGNMLYYRVQYNPNTQRVADDKPNSIKINNGDIIVNEDNLKTRELFNDNNDSEWANYFNVLSSDSMFALNFMNGASERCSGSRHSYRCSYDVGDSNGKEVINNYVVQKNDVGERLREEAVINLNFDNIDNLEGMNESEVVENEDTENFQETEEDTNAEIYEVEGEDDEDIVIENDRVVNPSHIRKKTKGENVSYDIFTDLIRDDVQAVVPYNFKNEIDMGDSGDDMAFAGETTKVDFGIVTKPKANSLVGGDAYATVVRNAMWKVKVCYGEGFTNCYESDTKTGDLHEYEDIAEESVKKDDGTSVSVTVPDLPAGTKIKVIAMAYPKDSGVESNSAADYYDPEKDESWVSAEKIITIAKKPSFQVWGGDIYMNKEASVPIANKRKLDGYDNGELGDGKLWVFGSWGELAVIANNAGNLASGAALGYTSNNGGELGADPGGGGNSTDKAILTFQGGGTTSIGVGSKYEKMVEMLSNRIEKVNPDNAVETTSVLNGLSIKSIEESKLYKNNGDIYISGDIKYDDNYDTLESIPKVVIYANNINIDCSVTRIDAVLIAESDVNTCPGDFDIAKNRAMNSTPLRINGTVIAGGTLKLNRTYGAATGDKSIVPAEIINMDPSWYLWAADIIPETTTGTNEPTSSVMIPTYMRELPPRY